MRRNDTERNQRLKLSKTLQTKTGITGGDQLCRE